jgi:hypothetical protein
VSITRDPWGEEQPDRSQANEPFVPRKARRHSTAQLGYGALACPVCELPVLLGGPTSLSGPLVCPFCLESSPARQFVRLDRFDTCFNVVEVRARLTVE